MLPKTGQTISYRDGDDGYYEAGWDGDRFTDNEDGTITDNATSLMWPKDFNSDGGNSGGGLDWNAAIDWAEALSFAGHDDWRLPNFNELFSILNRGAHHPAAYAAFENYPSANLWTSTVRAAYPQEAWQLATIEGDSYRTPIWFGAPVFAVRTVIPGGNPMFKVGEGLVNAGLVHGGLA